MRNFEVTAVQEQRPWSSQHGPMLEWIIGVRDKESGAVGTVSVNAKQGGAEYPPGAQFSAEDAGVTRDNIRKVKRVNPDFQGRNGNGGGNGGANPAPAPAPAPTMEFWDAAALAEVAYQDCSRYADDAVAAATIASNLVSLVAEGRLKTPVTPGGGATPRPNPPAEDDIPF